MISKRPLIEFHNDGTTSLYLPEWGTESGISNTAYASWRGSKDAHTYSIEALALMLKSTNVSDIYEALAAIGTRRLKVFLPQIFNIALYDEDINIITEALSTIHAIGGRRALKMTGTLRNTEHKDLIDILY